MKNVENDIKSTCISFSHDFKVNPNRCAILLSCSLISITFFCAKRRKNIEDNMNVIKHYENKDS